VTGGGWRAGDGLGGEPRPFQRQGRRTAITELR
jgi:hypothetical protein